MKVSIRTIRYRDTEIPELNSCPEGNQPAPSTDSNIAMNVTIMNSTLMHTAASGTAIWLNTTLASVVKAANKSVKLTTIDPSEAWRKDAPGSGVWSIKQIGEAYWFMVILYPILLALCTIGNVLNLVVLGSAKKKTTTTYYMMAMATADIILLWFGVPLFAWNTSVSLQLPYKTAYNKNATNVVRPYTTWGQEWSIQFCDWVLLVFSIERLVAVIRPFGVKWLHEGRTARIFVMILFPLAGAFTVYNFVELYFRNIVKNGFRSDDYMPHWVLKWQLVQLPAELSMILFKFFGLLLMNVWLIVLIKRQQRSAIGKQRSAQLANSDRKYRNSNLILVASVALYVICWFPSIVYQCLMLADKLHTYNFDISARNFPTPICQGIMFINYSVNFLLYLVVSKKYRAEFTRVCGPIFCPNWAKKHWRMIAESVVAYTGREKATRPKPKKQKPVTTAVSAKSAVTVLPSKSERSGSTDTVISLEMNGKEIPLTLIHTVESSKKLENTTVDSLLDPKNPLSATDESFIRDRVTSVSTTMSDDSYGTPRTDRISSITPVLSGAGAGRGR